MSAVPQTAEEWMEALHAIHPDDRPLHRWRFDESQRTEVVESMRRIVAATPFEVDDDCNLIVAGVRYDPMMLGYPIDFQPSSAI
jgi:hypothetical protein